MNKRHQGQYKILPFFLIAVLFLLCGCGTAPIQTKTAPDGYIYSTGIGNTGFLIPDGVSYTEVTNTGDMTDENTPYKLKTAHAVVYIDRTAYVIAEYAGTGITSENFSSVMEKEAHVRLSSITMQSSETLPDTGIRKEYYSCLGEGLFTDLIYGDYTGNLCCIYDGENFTSLFVGTTSLNDATDGLSKSLWYKGYETPANAGKTESDDGNGDGVSDVNTGTFGEAKIAYRGDAEREITIGIRLDAVDDAKDYIIKQFEQASPFEKLDLSLKSGSKVKWMEARFTVDWRGYDVSKTRPDIPIIFENEKGENTSVLKMWNGKDSAGYDVLRVLYLSDEKTGVFKAGQEYTLKLHV